MKAVVRTEALQRAVGVVERVTAKNTALPILNNILLQVTSKNIRLSATNLEVGITTEVAAKTEGEGRIAVPARILADLVRVSRAEMTTLTISQNTLTVVGDGQKTNILCFEASEYPIIPTISSATTYQLSASDLRVILGSVIESVAVSESRPELSGALLILTPSHTTIAATDSFRLVERRIPATHTHEQGVIIPRSTIIELLRVLEGNGDVTIHIADNQIAFTGNDFTLTSRLIDGKYPDYQKVIPDRFIGKALVASDQLENAVKVAALFSSTISDIQLQCSEGRLVVSAKNASKGEGEVSIDATLKGEPFEISLNYHYILDGLKAIHNEKTVLHFTGKGSPFTLRPSGDEQVVYVIMPLRG